MEPILNLGDGGGVIDRQAMVNQAMVMRATDPVITPQPYVTPTDFAAQFPTPLNTTELIAMCEELSAWRAIPEEGTALKEETWRELNELAFTSGSSYISFADGACPEEYTHDGDNTTITLKNIGAKKTLSISDILHSTAVSGISSGGYGVGINRLIGGIPSSEGMPGGSDMASFAAENVAGVKEKEIRLASTLTLNGWDRLLILGSVSGNSLEFNGIENLVTIAAGAHTNSAAPSATFSATSFDRFLSEGCAKPTHVFGHTQAIQEMLSGFFQLGFQGSQTVFFDTGNRITPGMNYAGFVNTGIGRLTVVSDFNFTRTNINGTTFASALFPLRMNHNGVPLVVRKTQIPFGINDLVPGCTAISFMVWAKTALVIKHICAHGRYIATFTGAIVTTCPRIG